MTAMRPIAIVLAALVVLVMAPPADAADFKLLGMDVEGDIEAGVRAYIERPSPTRRGKFEEYRDLPPGPFLERFNLRLLRPDSPYSTELGGSKWGQDDQEYSLATGRLGLWQFGFEWDQTPHVHSTTARFLGTETSRGFFVLPTPRPLPRSHNAAPEIEIAQRWDTARLHLMLTPTPDLDIRAQYTRINKDGEKPFGMAFGTPGSNVWEILEPIEHTIQEFRLRGTWMRETWQVQAGYTLSTFNNSLKAVLASNPCKGLVAAATQGGCSAGDVGAAAPTIGQVSLPPDNMAHTVNVQGAISLPLRTRLSANLGYSMRLQNDPFLPHTINPTLIATGDPGLILPRRSLNGFIGTTTANLNLTSRPWNFVILGLKYRVFDHDSMSEEPLFGGNVENDRVLRTAPEDRRRAHGFEYTRHNADLDARWQLVPSTALTTGVGWEYWRRNEHREVRNSDEFSGKLLLDVNALDWLSVRLGYRPSFRRIEGYDFAAHAAHIVTEEVVSEVALQLPFLRKFDEGERDRQRFDAVVQLTPIETVSVTLTGEYRKDDYLGGGYGLRDATGWSAGIDVSWTPVERVAFFGGYVHEDAKQFMRSRFRTGTNDTRANDWVSDIIDTVDTLYVGVKTTLIPRVLDWSASANYAYALGRVQTRNPGDPNVAGNSTANPFPAFEDTLIRVDTALRYHFLKAWTASFGYAFESFQKNDWRTDKLNPFIPGVPAIFLGNDARNYAAHILGLTLAYRFQ